MIFERTHVRELLTRLSHPNLQVQAVVGPRQVGKSTLIRQVLEKFEAPTVFLSCKSVQYRHSGWIHKEWEIARLLARHHGHCVIAVDDAQRLPGWAPLLSQLHEEDIQHKRDIRIVITGSSELELMRQLEEKFPRRHEVLRAGYWTYPEMRSAFNWGIEQYLFYGGLPRSGESPVEDASWLCWVRELMFDFLLKEDVKAVAPAQNHDAIFDYFRVSSMHSGNIMSYAELAQQLPFSVKPTTLANYQKVLARAGLSSGLARLQDGGEVSRSASPKLQLSSNAWLTGMMNSRFDTLRSQGIKWKQLFKSAVGAHLLNFSQESGYTINYWFDRQHRIDFVLKKNDKLVPIVVMPGDVKQGTDAIQAFARNNPMRYALILQPADSPSHQPFHMGIEEFLCSAPWM